MKYKKLRSPIVWLGGKSYSRSQILPILAQIPHMRYVEPFGGGASVMLGKPPAQLEVYNDLDSGLYNFFMVLSNPQLFAKFYRRVSVLPRSRQLYNHARDTWQNETDSVERAVLWYVVARMSFSGIFGHGYSTSITSSRRGMSSLTSNWLSIIDMLPEIHARMQRVEIENQPASTILDRYDTDGTLFYCDPPYIADTRKSGKYTHEMSDAQHEELVNTLLNLKGYAVLSGYKHSIYDRLLQNDWKLIQWDTIASAAGRTRASGLQGTGNMKKHQKRTESLYISPNSLKHLTD